MAVDKYSFTGIISKVGAVTAVNGKYKEKCVFVVKNEDDGRQIAFTLFDESIYSLLQPREMGDKVKVTFTIKSTEYNGSWNTTCFAYDVQVVQKKAYGTGKMKPCKCQDCCCIRMTDSSTKVCTYCMKGEHDL